jgi:hypothetical protein
MLGQLQLWPGGSAFAMNRLRSSSPETNLVHKLWIYTAALLIFELLLSVWAESETSGRVSPSYSEIILGLAIAYGAGQLAVGHPWSKTILVVSAAFASFSVLSDLGRSVYVLGSFWSAVVSGDYDGSNPVALNMSTFGLAALCAAFVGLGVISAVLMSRAPVQAYLESRGANFADLGSVVHGARSDLGARRTAPPGERPLVSSVDTTYPGKALIAAGAGLFLIVYLWAYRGAGGWALVLAPIFIISTVGAYYGAGLNDSFSASWDRVCELWIKRGDKK